MVVVTFHIFFLFLQITQLGKLCLFHFFEEQEQKMVTVVKQPA